MIRSAYLQHLDEGHTEVEVGQVTANQTQTEHDTDGHNGATIACRLSAFPLV